MRSRLEGWAATLALLAIASGQDVNITEVDDPFALWPTVDPTSLATALNISIGCLDAMSVYLTS